MKHPELVARLWNGVVHTTVGHCPRLGEVPSVKEFLSRGHLSGMPEGTGSGWPEKFGIFAKLSTVQLVT
jgi:hypothetical protein